MKQRTYVAIDLKSFYASVECVERGLDPLTTNLVVADESRTDKTICLAVSPSLKSYGIPGRARLFEVKQKIKAVNGERMVLNNYQQFEGESYFAPELENKALELSFIVAPPQMKLYMEYSTKIYKIYLRYIAPEDIHVYSIDEVFIDVTNYLELNKMTAHELAMTMIRDVLSETGITATAGIGTNMYLAKIAMDIEAKHIPADKDGVRIAELDEKTYREKLWNHTPITDFWRVGKGYAKKLYDNNLYTMGDIARCSVSDDSYYNESLLYKLFGINAELLIDHAWGWEPCTIDEIKSYVPECNSISSGQVLQCPYDNEKARIIVREMTELMALDLVEKGVVTEQMVLTVVYDIENIKKGYDGEIKEDWYGRKIPKHAHGSNNIGMLTSSTRLMIDSVLEIFDRVVDKSLLIRKIYVVANHIVPEKEIQIQKELEQFDLFTDYTKRDLLEKKLKKENSLQHAMINIHKRYGKNAILKGTNFYEGATTIERNCQVGGHRA